MCDVYEHHTALGGCAGGMVRYKKGHHTEPAGVLRDGDRYDTQDNNRSFQ